MKIKSKLGKSLSFVNLVTMKSTITFLFLASTSLLWILWNHPTSQTQILSETTLPNLSYFGDFDESGNSEFKKTQLSDDGLLLEFRLGDSIDFPYLGIAFENTEKNETYNLPFYDSLKIDFDFLGEDMVPNGMTFQIITKPPERLQAKDRLLELHRHLKSSDITIGLDQFEMPEWYAKQQAFQKDIYFDNWLEKTTKIEILFSAKFLKKNQDYRLRINSIILGKNTRHYFWTLTGMISFLWIVSLLFFIKAKFSKELTPSNELDILFQEELQPIRQTLSSEKISITPKSKSRDQGFFRGLAEGDSVLPNFDIKKVELTDQDELWWIDIQEIVASEYMQSDINTDKVAEEIGISKRKVSQIISEKLNMTLQAWLSEIRLMEGARLLGETNEQVVQIAYHLGYNNVSHFNRQFKSKYQCSPSQYRQNK